MRDSYLQLPDQYEIKGILAAEADRSVPRENRDKHFVDFTTLCTLLDSYNLLTKALEETYTPDDVFDQRILDDISNELDLLCEKILANTPEKTQEHALQAAYQYLSEESAPEPSDIIFVFGSKARYRTEKAIELYQAGMADKLMFSGGTAFYESDSKPEILAHAHYAKEKGIPEDDIILETESITVADNVKRSLQLLENQDIDHDKIILVMSPFAQRRGLAHFQKFSQNISFLSVNSASSPKCKPGNWYKDEAATRVVINEWAKLRFAQMLNTA